ncbi:hypothetical protein FOTG_18711 [Fusarium oxysporum f. sp. vasinfectum 25433]|uniref:Uncharacterized protein n=1 Tax=Fusarium oxysporum f. sp. vasinfectum 25433 TaxID=1089449 RepID=X0LWI0_FUSOX|nr:hypothetical protein FOTG_18711 [Fusarium oxysporum f. sp. vasinfectum 25433]
MVVLAITSLTRNGLTESNIGNLLTALLRRLLGNGGFKGTWRRLSGSLAAGSPC